MSEHKIRKIRKLPLCKLPQCMDIGDDAGVAIGLRKKAVFRIACNRGAVTEMVVSDDVVSVLRQIVGKIIVSFHKFYHTVGNLQNGEGFTGGLPGNGVNLCFFIRRRVCKMLFHKTPPNMSFIKHLQI